MTEEGIDFDGIEVDLKVSIEADTVRWRRLMRFLGYTEDEINAITGLHAVKEDNDDTR